MDEAKDLLSRRAFLGKASIVLGALAGIVVSVPIVAYLLTPLLQRPARRWQDLGEVERFAPGETVQVAIEDPSSLPWAGETARTAAWLRRTEEGEFVAFAVNCTHLGCPVNWIPGGQLFLCPCHGGVFTADGEPAGGPPQHPLRRHQVRVQNGRVELLPTLGMVDAVPEN